MTTSNRVAQLKASIESSKELLQQLQPLKESGTTLIESSDGTYVDDIDYVIQDSWNDIAGYEYELGELEDE